MAKAGIELRSVAGGGGRGGGDPGIANRSSRTSDLKTGTAAAVLPSHFGTPGFMRSVLRLVGPVPADFERIR